MTAAFSFDPKTRRSDAKASFESSDTMADTPMILPVFLLKGMHTNIGRRRRRDSNPRPAYAESGFQDRPVQPLRHSSLFMARVTGTTLNALSPVFRNAKGNITIPTWIFPEYRKMYQQFSFWPEQGIGRPAFARWAMAWHARAGDERGV